MKISITIKIIAMLFIMITAVLLLLTVFNIIGGTELREAILKLAAVCGIIAAAAMAMTFINKK